MLKRWALWVLVAFTFLIGGLTLARGGRSAAESLPAEGIELLPGQRAIFIAAPPERGLGGALRAGQRLDLLAIDAAGGAAPLVSSVQVLEPRSDFGGPLAEGDYPGGVLVAVTPAEAVAIAQALDGGNLYLTLVPEGE